MQKPMRLKSYGGLVALLLGLMSFFGFAGNASAQSLVCTASPTGNWRINFGDVRDTTRNPIGTVLATASVTAATVTITCANRPSNPSPTNRAGFSALTDYAWGTGLRVNLLFGGRTADSSTTYRTFTSAGTYTVNGADISAQLIKNTTGRPALGACGATRGRVFFYLGTTGTVGTEVGTITICGTSLTQTAPTCTVNNTSITIPLGNVAGSSFASVGSVSTTSAAQNIGLSCTLNPRVRMTLQGSAVAGTSNVMPLTGAGTAGVAQGVGVQVLYRNPGATSGEAVLTPGTGVTLSTAAGATLSVPILARYYRTGTVTAGRANAAPTLLFDYP